MLPVNFSIQLYRGKTLGDGTHPIVAMTSVAGVVKRISLPRLRVGDPPPAVTSAQWDSEDRRVTRAHKDRARINEIITHFESRGREIIGRMLALGQAFDHERFKGELLLSDDQRKAHEQSRTDVFAMFNTIINEMEKDGRVGTASAYRDAMSALRLFQCKGDKAKASKAKTRMPYSDVSSIAGVKAWASFMIERGNSEASAGMRLRQLRAVLYRARAERIISFDDIPFKNVWNPGGLKVSNYQGDLALQPLIEAETAKLLNAKPEEPRSAWAVDVYRLLIAMCGPNMADIAALTKDNVRAGRIHYRRMKSRRTQQEAIEVSLNITPAITEIFERYKGEGQYLLPILGPQYRTPKQRKYALQQAIRMINDRLVKLAQELGIDSHVTTKTARTTAATMLKNLGVAPDVINELQGRANAGMLKHYAPAHRYRVLDDAQAKLWALATNEPTDKRKPQRARVSLPDAPAFRPMEVSEGSEVL
jgi:hypothetical protein